MSILIKDVEMPKNCEDCLTNYMLNVVCDCDLNNIEDGRRLPNCPLVELPLFATSMPQLNISSPILDPEWQKEHKAMGFWSPLADLYEELGIIPAEESEI